MENTQAASYKIDIASSTLQSEIPPETTEESKLRLILKKLRGGFFLVIGFLLSPMSWWNDLFFNLPIAYGFGYLCSLLSPNLLVPCSIAGYWLSNILGIMLMQAGAMDVLQESQERNLKKELLTGFASSTAYTLLILVLIYFKIIDAPSLFPGN
jgi:hypothetical protein